ncbi:MAG: DUF3575 domain-containing protein [Elusimicrobia bacterium]|nr:DUF3575 domain-containing protein [Elusimicrobiota bacterium]
MKIILSLILLFWGVSSARGEQAENWYIGPRVGFVSPFTGILGFEIQRRHFALCAGLPGTYGAKYYFSFPRKSWYVGLYVTRFNYTPETVEYEEGVPYDKKMVRRQGVGGGYRWRWGSGWDLDLSLGVGTVKDTAEYRGVETLRWTGTDIKAGPTIGYSF